MRGVRAYNASGMTVSPAVLACVFLRLGVLGFGGPAAHIALMHEEIVRRRRWISNADFLDLLAATNLIPGPNSTEMAIHIGRRLGGWTGFFIAGACFILPAAIAVGALAFLYIRYGQTPDARALLAGILPVITAIVVHATVQMSRASLKTATAWVIAVGCIGLVSYGVNEFWLLLAAGVLAAATRTARTTAAGAVLVAVTIAPVAAAAAALATSVTLTRLALVFLKIGSILYGSGYVLIALLRADLVERWGWLTDQQLLDAVAAGQVTPGPLFTTATFIGAVLAGWRGAVLATFAIFLPAFVFVALTQPLIPRVRRSPAASAFLDGVVAASLGLVAAACWWLGRAALIDAPSSVLALLAFVVLVRWRLNSAWLIAVGGVAGLEFR
jgi:chromate transporter